MKLNQWTLGLAAVGVVTLASAVQADEAKNQVLTAVSSTTISGYVSTSARWDVGSTAGVTQYKYGTGKSDGFNLDVVDLTIAKNPGEGDWAAGYKAELWLGPDAAGIGTAFNVGTVNTVAIKQAYVSLRAPVGNGLDLKLGVFDGIIGYESHNGTENPNYTRSWGLSLAPAEHTGLLASYRFCDSVSATAGVANTTDAMINGRYAPAGVGSGTSQKTYLAAMTLTAPDSFGFLKGGTLTAGYVDGRASTAVGGPNTQYVYVGTTLPTGLDGLTLGAAYNTKFGNIGDSHSYAAYLSYKATDKLKLNTRVEYFNPNGTVAGLGANATVLTGTFTADYALWENVISRAEYRWDHDASGQHSFTGGRNNDNMIALNLIYKF